MDLKGFLKSPKAQRNALLLVVAGLLLALRMCKAPDAAADLTYKQNIAALQDSVRTYRDRNGALVYEKMALISDVGGLRSLNSELANEVQYLKDHPLVVTRYKTVIVHDTVWLTPSVDAGGITYRGGRKTVPFTWSLDTTYAKDNFRKMRGMYLVEADSAAYVDSKRFAITSDSLGMTFTTGITENKSGMLEIFVKSPYPGFSAYGMDGALIDPRTSEVIRKFFPPKRWGLGPYIGYGVTFGPGGFGHGASAGIAVHYGIIQWGKK
jgi:hypothetical protein